MFKKRLLFSLLLIALLVIPVAPSLAQDGYGEAPMLAEMVEAGELPPVEERLPLNPKVIPVVDEIGTYGGTLRVADTNERLDEGLRMRQTGLFRYNFTASVYEADLAESWEWSDGFRTITIKLREGLHWSDGDPFDVEDFAFYWNDILLNEELNPGGLGGFWAHGGEPATFEVIDDYTFSYTWAAPNPTAMDTWGRANFSADNALFVPSHYVKQFHADYNDDAQALAEEEDYEDWMGLFNQQRCQCYQLTTVDLDRPYMDSFIPVEIESDRVLLERNPYFHQVDPEGNQLPYIDYLEVTLVGDQELYALKLTAGELDFGVRYTRASDLQLFKQSEESGNYTTYIAQSLRPTEFTIFLNRNYPEEPFKSLFSEKDFRSALSMSINRDQMNDILFFGLGEVHPPTPLKTLPWFDDAWYNDYLEYMPEKSNELLDGLGLTEKDSEGIRLFESGERVSIIIQGFVIHMDACELIANDFRQVGVELICQEASPDRIAELRMDNAAMATIWHLGRATLFGRGTPDDFAFVDSSRHKWASQWALWLITEGEPNEDGEILGIEPPQEIKDLDALWDEFSLYPSDSPEAAEIGSDYFAYFAEEIPFIATIGLGPQPVIYTNRLHNVPTEDIFWASDTNFYSPFNIEQWFFME